MQYFNLYYPGKNIKHKTKDSYIVSYRDLNVSFNRLEFLEKKNLVYWHLRIITIFLSHLRRFKKLLKIIGHGHFKTFLNSLNY